MLILAKAAQVDTDITPNLGTMLLFHLTRQAHQHHAPITGGGVITLLANSLGLDLSNLAQLTGKRVVGITTLRATGMITQQQGRIFIRIPGVGELFPTPMPNLFSIEDGVLHYLDRRKRRKLDPKKNIPRNPTLKQKNLKRRNMYPHSTPPIKTSMILETTSMT